MAANPPGMPAEVTAETAYKQVSVYIYIYNIFPISRPHGPCISQKGAANISRTTFSYCFGLATIRSISEDGHVSDNTGFDSANI